MGSDTRAIDVIRGREGRGTGKGKGKEKGKGEGKRKGKGKEWVCHIANIKRIWGGRYPRVII